MNAGKPKTKRLMSAAAALLILAVLVWQFRPQPETGTTRTASGQIEFSREEFQHFSSNMAATLQQARIVPQMNADGSVQCFRFTEIQADSFFARMGLQANDCILSVNGEAIASFATAMSLNQNLKDASSVKLSVIRGDQTEELEIVLK